MILNSRYKEEASNDWQENGISSIVIEYGAYEVIEK